ncbi:MAG: hypothetical protein ACRDH2_18860 [Anaerolineales bacterium]
MEKKHFEVHPLKHRRTYARLIGLAGLLLGMIVGAGLGASVQWLHDGGLMHGLSLGLLTIGMPAGFVLSSLLARRVPGAWRLD